MNVYLKVALAYLRKQKSRTWLMILGVALAVMLVFGFNVMNETQSKNQLDYIYNTYGGYHAEFFDINSKQLDRLKKDKDIKRIDAVCDLGTLQDSKGGNLDLYSSNSKYIEGIKYTLNKGRYPINENEIVLEGKALVQMKLSSKLNQEINFKIRKEYKNKDGVNKFYIKDKKFILVGIVEKPEVYYEDYYSLNAFTYYDGDSGSFIPNDLVTYRSVVNIKSGNSQIEKNVNKIRERNNIGRLNYESNTNLVRALSDYNQSKNSQSDNKIKLMVMFTAILLIYNLFNINLIDMVKNIGTMRIIGASKRDIRIIIGIQSLIILICGLILGFVLGIAFSYVGMNFFNFTDVKRIKSFDLIISRKSITDALLLGSITVVVSTIIPIYMSGRISAIEASKYSDIGNKKKSTKSQGTSMIKSNNVTSRVALLNIFRNKFRTIVSIIAISIGGVTFVDTYSSDRIDWDSFHEFLSETSSLAVMSGNVNSDPYYFGFNDRDVKEMSKINGVYNVFRKNEVTGFMVQNTDGLEAEYKKYNGIVGENENIELPMSLKAYDRGKLFKYADQVSHGELEYIYNNDSEYPIVAVFNYYYDILQDHRLEKVRKNISVGDLIEIKVANISGENISYKTETVKVGVILDQIWTSKGDSSNGRYPEIIISPDNFKAITGKKSYNYVYVDTNEKNEKKSDSILKNLDSLSKKIPFSYRDGNQDIKADQDMYRKEFVISKMIIVSLILLISSINIFCSIRANILIKINEFSTYRAIGMSLKQLKVSIYKESLIYAFISSAIVAIVGSYNYYELASRVKRDYVNLGIKNAAHFEVPLTEIMIFVSIAIVVCLISAYMSNRSLDKMNIIEGLNKTE